MEKFKSNLFMKIGNFFFTIGFNYKTGGFKAVYKYYILSLKFKIFKWHYFHSKKFRDKVIGENGITNLFGKAIIENIFFNKPVDYKKVYNSLTNEEKAKIKADTEQAIKLYTEKYNITDEKEIDTLRKMFNFENS